MNIFYRSLIWAMLLLSIPAHSQIVKNRSIVREILFETGSSRIEPSEQSHIASICKEVHRRDNYRIRLTGNTDSVGTYESNLTLSEARAQAVARALTSCGIPSSSIAISGVSFSKPKESNATEEGKAKNRRTRISLILIYFSVSALEPVDALKPGSTLDLNVLFDFNSARIKPSSFEGLSRILKVLHENPELRFEILGWTAISQSSDDLSGRRAKAVYEHFLAEGISKERMQYAGMGGAGCSERMIEKCRRVEIVIIQNPYLKSKPSKP